MTEASPLRRVCVFCGSSPGAQAAFGDAVEQLGLALAADGIGIVYGGASVGLMGRLADHAGGRRRGSCHPGRDGRAGVRRGLADLRVVASMHERKSLMADLADVRRPARWPRHPRRAFEILTWANGLHTNRGLLEVGGYFAPRLPRQRRRRPHSCAGAADARHRWNVTAGENPVKEIAPLTVLPHAVNRTGTTPCCKTRSRLPSSRWSSRVFARKGRNRIANRDDHRSERRNVCVWRPPPARRTRGSSDF